MGDRLRIEETMPFSAGLDDAAGLLGRGASSLR
jgi:hypothetical protein